MMKIEERCARVYAALDYKRYAKVGRIPENNPISFLMSYPSEHSYVEEWWEERYLPIVKQWSLGLQQRFIDSWTHVDKERSNGIRIEDLGQSAISYRVRRCIFFSFVFLALASVLLLAGCGDSERQKHFNAIPRLSNEKIVEQTEFCTSHHLYSYSRTNAFGETVQIECFAR